MKWSLRYGDFIKAFLERQKATGVTPPPLLSRPRLRPGDIQFVDAFNALSRSRIHAPGIVGRILISEILAFLELKGIASLPARAKYLRFMQMMDDLFIDHHQAKNE